MLRHVIRSALLSALLMQGFAVAARADLPKAEAELGVPVPEQTEPTSEQPAPAAEATPLEPASPEGPNLATEPVVTLQRPKGVWGPVAVVADVLVMRPIGLLSLVPGAAAFVLVSPVRAATGGLGDSVDALHERTKDVFTRPLGAL